MITSLQRQLIDHYQRGLPLVPQPFAAMAAALDVSEAEVIQALEGLQASGTLSRVGAIVEPNTAGASTLAAIEVAPDQLEAVAAKISAIPEVNHNYEREHSLNLWFVVAASTAAKLEAVIARIEDETGYPVICLPLEEAFHLDTGFPIKWN